MGDASPRALTAAERLDWLRLARTPHVGPITFRHLLERCGSAAAAIEVLPELARRGGRGRSIKICPAGAAEREIEALDRLGARLIARAEPDYPPLLAEIEDAPPLISVRGRVDILTRRAVAVVGPRNASLNGRNFARGLARDLGAKGLLVVSGMARGIDTSAHEGALESGTLAVLAGGIDIVYPPENRGLYEKIADLGAVISEMPPGTEPQARHFPIRNRLISGSSLGVVVVEASPKSGSLITARMALEQGREVFAVPGSPLDPRARGTHQLLRDGAILTENADDVSDALNPIDRNRLREHKSLFLQQIPAEPATSGELDRARASIAESLGPVPVTVDEIIRTCQFSPPLVSTVLLELELAGRLERHPGNRVALIAGP